jgi:NAD+ kinase
MVRRSPEPVRLARLHPAAFTDRLVRKFRLPVEGWRGPISAEPETWAMHEPTETETDPATRPGAGA